MKEEMFMGPVSIWNPYSDPKQWAWKVENCQKDVISLIKYTVPQSMAEKLDWQLYQLEQWLSWW